MQGGLVIRCAAAALAVWLAADVAGGEWWAPGDGRPLPSEASYANASGALGILNIAGTIDTAAQPFFQPLGANGRACVTCHQPADAMALSVATVRERWEATGGRDPLFAAVDGRNCPNLPAGDPASHSLLLTRGLIRVALPWPPRDARGTPLPVQFALEVVRDPTGCNTNPFYALIQRRPLTASELKLFADQFYFVMKHFPRIIAGLASRIDIDEVCAELAKTVVVELGEGQPGRAHWQLFEKAVIPMGISMGDWRTAYHLPETLALVDGVRTAIKNGLALLAVDAPEEM